MKHREVGEICADGGNISATGLFLKITHPSRIAVGDELAAELAWEQDQSLQPQTRLRVVRIAGDGVGLAFI